MTFDDILRAQAMCAVAWSNQPGDHLLRRTLLVSVLIARHGLTEGKARDLAMYGTDDEALDMLLVAAEKERSALLEAAEKELRRLEAAEYDTPEQVLEGAA